MPGPNRHAPDEARISTTAALVALGGHAVVILAALLLAGRTQDVAVASGVVGVTLVNAVPGATGSAPSTASAPELGSASTSERSTENAALSGERLDGLFAREVPPATNAAPTAGISAAQTRRGGSGSSRADPGLGQGEGAEGIDLYAAASLPNVGARPISPPAGDLWQRVAPCWRAASPKKVTLSVEIRDDGGLAGFPQAVRKMTAPADAQILLAERAAARALQACAPYAGLQGRRWRVEFP